MSFERSSETAGSVRAVLSELRLTGLGVIEDAVLEPHPGLTAVTGETGAGKTMVVTALDLIGGGRADTGRVRAGADRAAVEARLQLAAGHPAAAAVEAAGGRSDDDGSLILVRTVSADGRSRAHAGGRSVPLATLAEITEPLIAVHGQSEAISLLRPAEQRRVLDRYASCDDLLGAYRRVRTEWLTALTDLRDRTEHARERAQREQLLRLGVDEIDKLNPVPGEDLDLVSEVKRLENADGLRVSAETAQQALAGESTDGSLGAVGSAANAVQLIEAARKTLAACGDDRIARWADDLHQAAAVLVDAAADLSTYLADLDSDPTRLEQVMTRQAELRTLTRRYAADIDGVLAWRTAALGELAGLDSSDDALAALRQECAELAGRVATAGRQLSNHRSAAAARLADLASAELEHLAMARAAIRVQVAPRIAGANADDVVELDGQRIIAGPDGLDHVEILLRAHASAPELPLARGASGGELSRVMLALEVVLAAADPVGTLVFDEVDAGVGGRAATEIGLRLALLARTHQVIVVTHLAQVAAFADRQVVVDAADDGAVRASCLRTVDASAREAELARMLGGRDDPVARAHAAELWQAATKAKSAKAASVAAKPAAPKSPARPSAKAPAASLKTSPAKSSAKSPAKSSGKSSAEKAVNPRAGSGR